MELNLHLQEKHETIGTIKCDFCDHTFFDDISLRRHRLLVHKNLIHRFSCKICPVKTVEKGSMVQHYKKIHSLEISRDQVKRNGENLDMYDCEHCEKSFDQKNSLNTHIKTVHLKIRHILCTRCPKTFQSHGHFKHHINSDHGGDYVEPKVLRDRLECPICHSKSYPNKSLKDHLKKDHKVSKDLRKLNLQKTVVEDSDHKKCTVLENSHIKIDEGSKANILGDRRNKDGSTNLLFDSTFKDDEGKVKKIVELDQTSSLKLPIETKMLTNCSDTTLNPEEENSKNSQKIKNEVHLAVESVAMKFECLICQKMFIHRNSLVAHLRQKHKDDLKYKCNHTTLCNCDNNDLNLMISTPKSLYQCQICSKSYYDKYKLDEHVQGIHEGGHKCQICDKCFSHRRTLDHHLLKVHDDTKNDYRFECDTCHQLFYEIVHLKKHMIEKHGLESSTTLENGQQVEKNDSKRTLFLCKKCCKYYASTYWLDKHLKESHKILPKKIKKKNFKCGICNHLAEGVGKLKKHKRIKHNLELGPADKFKEENLIEYLKSKRSLIFKHGLEIDANYKFEDLAAFDDHQGIENNENHPAEIGHDLKTKQAKELGKFNCDICNHRFTRAGHLNKHKKSIHEPKNDAVNKLDDLKTLIVEPEQYYEEIENSNDVKIEMEEYKEEPQDFTSIPTSYLKSEDFTNEENTDIKSGILDILPMQEETDPLIIQNTNPYEYDVDQTCIDDFYEEEPSLDVKVEEIDDEKLQQSCFVKMEPLDLNSIGHVLKTNPSKELGNFNCDICNRRFTRIGHLNKHKQSIHEPKNDAVNKLDDLKTKKLFSCEKCPKRYDKSFRLTKHIKTAHAGFRHKCSFCPRDFTEKKTLEKHVKRLHENGGRSKCPICSIEFEFHYQIKGHIQEVHKEEIPLGKAFKCNICSDVGFANERNLQRHLKNLHDNVKPAKVYCLICHDLGFATFKNFIQHMFDVHQEKEDKMLKENECFICLKQFNGPQSLSSHIIQKHYKSQPLECEICGKAFIEKQALENHIVRLHEQEGEQKCPRCPLIFQDLSILRDHIKNEHEEEITFTMCELCGIEFSSANRLKIHMEKYHKIFNGKVQCDICDKYFTPNRLKAHSQNCKIKPKCESGKKAAIESQFCCDQCGRKFSKNYRLIEHVAVVHTKELKIECDFCGKSFTGKESYQRHLVSRHDNKALECKKCKLTFSDKVEMKAHMQSFHSIKEPTFNCTKCSKQFGTIYTLKKHTASQHEGKTSKCDICGKILSDKHKLRVHKEFVHEGKRPHECSKCKSTFYSPYEFKKHRQNVVDCSDAINLFIPNTKEGSGRPK